MTIEELERLTQECLDGQWAEIAQRHLVSELLAALKEQDRQLHEGQDNQTQEAMDMVLAENTRLRAAIKEAPCPVALGNSACPKIYSMKRHDVCDCWKSKALENPNG